MIDKGFEGVEKNIPLLVALLTILAAVSQFAYNSNFLQFIMINEYWRENFSKSIIIASVSFLFLILYVIFKGFYNLSENVSTKAALSSLAKLFHTLFLTTFFMLFLYIFLNYIILRIPANYRSWGGFLLIVGCVFFILCLFFLLGSFFVHYIFAKRVKGTFSMDYELDIESRTLVDNYFRVSTGCFILFIKLIFLFIICIFIWLIPFSWFSIAATLEETVMESTSSIEF